MSVYKTEHRECRDCRNAEVRSENIADIYRCRKHKIWVTGELNMTFKVSEGTCWQVKCDCVDFAAGVDWSQFDDVEDSHELHCECGVVFRSCARFLLLPSFHGLLTKEACPGCGHHGPIRLASMKAFEPWMESHKNVRIDDDA